MRNLFGKGKKNKANYEPPSVATSQAPSAAAAAAAAAAAQPKVEAEEKTLRGGGVHGKSDKVSGFDFINNANDGNGVAHGAGDSGHGGGDVTHGINDDNSGKASMAAGLSMFANMDVKTAVSVEESGIDKEEEEAGDNSLISSFLTEKDNDEEDDNDGNGDGGAKQHMREDSNTSQFSFIEESTVSETHSTTSSTTTPTPSVHTPTGRRVERPTRRRKKKTPVVGYARKTVPTATNSSYSVSDDLQPQSVSPAPSNRAIHSSNSTIVSTTDSPMTNTKKRSSVKLSTPVTSSTSTPHDRAAESSLQQDSNNNTSTHIDENNDNDLIESDSTAPSDSGEPNDDISSISDVSDSNDMESTNERSGISQVRKLFSEGEEEMDTEENEKDDPLESEWWQLQTEMKKAFDDFGALCHSISAEKRDIFSKKRRYEDKLEQIVQDIEFNEKQLQIVMDREDFERADQLQTRIDEAELKRTKTKQKQANLDNQLEEFENRAAELPKHIWEKQKVFKERMESFYGKYRNDFREFVRDSQLRVNFGVEKIKSEEDRLAREENNMKHDVELIENRRQRLQSRIDEQTKDIRKERDELAEKLSVLELETQELRRQLAVKEEECSHTRKGMKQTEKLIAKQKSKFDRELRELTTEEDSYEKKHIAFKDEQQEFLNEKVNIEQERANLQERQQIKHHQLQMLRISIRISRRSVTILDHFSVFKKDLRRVDESSKDNGSDDRGRELEKLRQQHQSTLHEVQDCEKHLSDIKSSITILKRQLQDATDNTFPQLEREKRQAAKSRNFKEAAKIKEQLQTLTEKHQQWQKQLGDQQDELKCLQDNFESKQREERELYDKMKSMMAEQHMDEIRTLLQEQCVIEKMLQTVQFHKSSATGDADSPEDMSRNSSAVMEDSLALMLSMQKEMKQYELDQISKKIELSDDRLQELHEAMETQLQERFDKIQGALKEHILEEERDSLSDASEPGSDDEKEIEDDRDGALQEETQDNEKSLPEPGDNTSSTLDGDDEAGGENDTQSKMPHEKGSEAEPIDMEQVLHDLSTLHEELALLEERLERAMDEEEYELCDELDTKIKHSKERIIDLEKQNIVAPEETSGEVHHKISEMPEEEQEEQEQEEEKEAIEDVDGSSSMSGDEQETDETEGPASAFTFISQAEDEDEKDDEKDDEQRDTALLS